jgi:hypothetical protein
MTDPAQPMPGENLPPTKLDEWRDALYQALRTVWTELGWPAERAHRIPPKRLQTPAAFVDVPTIHQAPSERARAVAATFPVVFLVDGDQDSQVRLQDKLLAHGWQQLDDVRMGEPGRQQRAIVQTAGPEDVDMGGALTRGLVFRVQVGLQTQTLCPQPLVQTTTDEEQ